MHTFNSNDELTIVARQKLEEQKSKNTYLTELEECKTKLSKLSTDIDNIYNDKLSGILSQDDFTRIYERKKQEKLSLQNRIETLNSHTQNNIVNEDELINKLIQKFNSNLTINREILTDLVDRIEIDDKKKVYIYFKFRCLNSDSN